MRHKARYLLLVAAFAAAGWAAAPALSVQPYLPAAEDFDQRLPELTRVAGSAAKRSAARGGEGGHAHDAGHDHARVPAPTPVDHVADDDGPVTHRSTVIEAPKRFDLAGLAGELRHYELRARTSGGQWSDWVEATDGNPIYFGGADQLQVRARGWRPAGRLHYVNVSGTATPAGRLLNGARKAANTAFASVAAIVDPVAVAAVRRPKFVNRRAWGANRSSGGCQPRTSPDYGQVRAVVVHHTVTASEYTEAQAPSIVLGICRFHRNGNGWNDIGYNAVTDRFGTLYVGRAGGIGRAVVGAHAQGFNAQTSGIATLGTHTSQPVTPRARRGFARYIAWKTARHGIPIRGQTRLRSAGGSASRYPAGRRIRSKRLIGHRRVNLTACPGDALNQQIRQIRRRAVAIRQAAQEQEDSGQEDPAGADPGAETGGQTAR